MNVHKEAPELDWGNTGVGIPYQNRLKIYIASSWRNNIQPLAVRYLRAEGFHVYDFRNPCEGNHGFHWSEIDPEWQSWDADKYIKALEHPIAKEGFRTDWSGIRWADACLLLLPCGRSAHIEAGYFVGAEKFLVVMVTERNEPELMYKMANAVVKDLDSAVKFFKRIKKTKGGYLISTK